MSSVNEVRPTNAEAPVVSAPPAERSMEENGATVPNTAVEGQGVIASQAMGAEGAGEGTIMASRAAVEWGGGSADTGSYDELGQRRRTWASGDLDLTPEMRQRNVQEKNRLAQRRFRERQKAKVQDLHSQIGDLKSEVGVLLVQNTALSSQNKILEKVLAMRAEQISVLQDNDKLPTVEGQDVREHQCTTLTLSALKGQPVNITCDMLKKMSAEEVMQLWHTYVTEISAALVNANSNTPASVARIEQLTQEICMVCMRFAVLRPISSKTWQVRQYHMSEAEELKRWQAIVSTLELTQEQKGEVIELRKMLLTKLQELVTERGQLNLTIQTSLPTSMVGHKISLEYLKTNQAVVRLKEILRAEHNAMLDFICTTIKQVLRPLQVARLMVQAYPSKPDMLAVASAVAADLGEDMAVPQVTEPPAQSPMGSNATPQFRTPGATILQSAPINASSYQTSPSPIPTPAAPRVEPIQNNTVSGPVSGT